MILAIMSDSHDNIWIESIRPYCSTLGMLWTRMGQTVFVNHINRYFFRTSSLKIEYRLSKDWSKSEKESLIPLIFHHD